MERYEREKKEKQHAYANTMNIIQTFRTLIKFYLDAGGTNRTLIYTIYIYTGMAYC